MRSEAKNRLESRMLGNLHVRFGVGVGKQPPGLHHNLSPEAVTSVAAHIQGASTNDPMVDQQVRWFSEQLVKLLGGNTAYAQLMNELGL